MDVAFDRGTLLVRGADAPRGDGFAWDEVAGMVRCAASRYHELAARAAYDGVRPKLAKGRVAPRPRRLAPGSAPPGQAGERPVSGR